jgi:O-antigen/teichoic acid export membrane protein
LEQAAPEVDFPWQKLSNYAWQVVIFFLAYELLISIDLYMVKAIVHDNELTGIYNAALTVGRIPYYIFYAMTIFLLPMVSKASSNNNLKNAKAIIDNALRIMLILLAPMVILMSTYAQEILQLLYGKKYLAGAPAMAVLVYGVGFLTIFYVLSFALNGAGKTKVAMLVSTVGVILNSALNYFFIKKMGIIGSAYATSITSFIIMLWLLYFVKKDFDANFQPKEVFRVAGTSLLIYFLAYLLPSGKYLFIIDALFIFTIYIVALYFVGGIDKKDMSYFMSLVRKRKESDVSEELSGNEPAA